MALQHGARMAQLLDFLFGKESLERQSAVQPGGAVALGQHQPVPALPLGIPGIHMHFVKIEIGQGIRHRQGAAGMTALGVKRPLNDLHPDFGGQGCQLLLF